MQSTKWEFYEYQRSRSVIDLGSNHLHSIFLNFFSSITAEFNISSAIRWAIQDQWSSGCGFRSKLMLSEWRWDDYFFNKPILEPDIQTSVSYKWMTYCLPFEIYRYFSYIRLLGSRNWKVLRDCSILIFFPFIQMDYIDVGTSLSNKYYLGQPEGETYGLDHGKDCRYHPEMSMYLRPESGVPGLYLTGRFSAVLDCFSFFFNTTKCLLTVPRKTVTKNKNVVTMLVDILI